MNCVAERRLKSVGKVQRSFSRRDAAKNYRGIVVRGLKPTATIIRSLRDEEPELIEYPSEREITNPYKHWNEFHVPRKKNGFLW